MKKLVTLLTITLFITSCSTKFSLQKRKYNKGFYFATSTSKNNETKENNIKPSKLNTKSYTIAKVENQIPVINENVTENNYHKAYEIKKSVNTKFNNQPKNRLIAFKSNKVVLGETAFKKLEYNKTKSARASDTNIIILVILSIFPILCLIAVYLKDGKNITLNFWIDLLLHLTAIGEIIFALLVVLDIVNLA